MNGKTSKPRWRAMNKGIRRFFWRRAVRLFARELVQDLARGILGDQPAGVACTPESLALLRAKGDPAPVITDFLAGAGFRGLMGHAPDAENTRLSVDYLTENHDLAGFIAELSNSPDFREQQLAQLAPSLVRSVCRVLLGEDVSPERREEYVRLITDQNLDAMFKAVADSPAFRRRHAYDAFAAGLESELTPAAVRAAFHLILGYEADEKDIADLLPLRTAQALREKLLRSSDFRGRWSRLFAGERPTAQDIDALKTVFLHMPKTGGTTLHEILVPQFPPEQVCPERHDGLHQYTSGDLAKYRLFSGHYYLESVDLIPGPKRIVTMLRHPVDRLVSLYNFLRAHREEYIQQQGLSLAGLAREHSMRDFFSLEEVRRHPSLNSAMVRTLVSSPTGGARWEHASALGADLDATDLLGPAKDRLRSLAAFGILERYQESVEILFPVLGLPVPETVVPKMVLKDLLGSRTIDHVPPVECDPEARERIESLVGADLELYHYALERFDQQRAVLAMGGGTSRLEHARIPEVVESAYRGLLDRAPDEEGEKLSIAFLAETQDLTAFLAELSNSAEFRKKHFAQLAPTLVRSACRALLGEDATAERQQEFVRRALDDNNLEGVLKSLLEVSPLLRQAGPAELPVGGLEQPLTPTLVKAAYRLILGQTANEDEIAARLPLQTLGALRETLLCSTEFRAQWSHMAAAAERPVIGEIAALKTVFLHVPKTGGTTMHEALLPHFPPEQVCPERFDGLYQYPSGNLAKYRFYSGHFYLESCELIPGPKRVITMMRHPASRLASVYNFLRAHTEEYIKSINWWEADLARQHSIEEYFALDRIRNFRGNDNAYTRRLVASPIMRAWEKSKGTGDTTAAARMVEEAKRVLHTLLEVGIMERYDESAMLIFHSLGLPLPEQIKPKMVLADLVGTAASIDTKVKRQKASPEALANMAPLIELDLQIYEEGMKIFEQHLQAFRASAAAQATAPDPVSAS